ncbi:hypothetical protein Syun_014183 [Stephania yunnanensis]|uniref:Deoxynucleoside kinase domain-containing protein n=1 Tax=Stephania yunnanensis TaxID=152371 RepID=A0AAP0JKI8_9MAGN
MQKLLRRSPSSPTLCTALASPSPLQLLNHHTHRPITHRSLPFPPSLAMPAAALFGNGLAAVAAVAKKSNSGPLRCGGCRCSLDTSAWVVFKEAKSVRASSKAAWVHTQSEGGLPLVVAAEGSGGAVQTNDGSEKALVRLQRRQRTSPTPGGPPPGQHLDLLAIPGVGPRNLRKLVDKGIGEVADLKQLYRDKFFGESSEKMVEFLQSSVGIIHKNHAESITSFIKERVDEELEEQVTNSDGRNSQNKRLTFCVEGNISVGKTTFLQRIANETIELRDLVEIVPEPINKWQDVGPDHFNILDAFYAEPQRYAYTFQNYVFVTRVMQERESAAGIKPLRLMERSVFSDRMVFVRAVHEANWMNEMEISIYDSWFDPVVSSLPGLIPDGFIYLRASPDTCHKRMMLRKRAEEGGVSLDYLRDLHDKHESWLFPTQSSNHGVLSISQLPLHMDRAVHPEIRDRVFFLEGGHMHSSIQKVPALVLDCEPNIDFTKDIEAKQQYARQVAEFFEFVKQHKGIPSSKVGADEKNSNQQVMLPHKQLWMPNSNQFPESALKSLDFKRAMSYLSG